MGFPPHRKVPPITEPEAPAPPPVSGASFFFGTVSAYFLPLLPAVGHRNESLSRPLYLVGKQQQQAKIP
jgi:hypothetical protein